jgi:hypothetical protein
MEMMSTFQYTIDGFILWLDTSKQESEKKEALLFPLQVTIASSHSKSEEKFFNHWEKWKKGLKGFDVKITFLWITDKDPKTQDIGEDSRQLKDRNVLKNPDYTSKYITIESVNKDIWASYEKALNDRERRGQRKSS